MAKPPLSMKPTGWFQVAWSDEIGVGDVHTMKYFDQEMVAWRARVGPADRDERVLRTPRRPPGFRRQGRSARCCSARSTGGSGTSEGRNVCIPYQDRPNRGRRIRTYPVVERNESVYIWHDVEGREPYFDAPDVFAGFDDGSSAERLLPAAAALPAGPGTAPAVRARKRRRLRAFQVRAQHPDRAGVHPPRLRRTRCPSSTSPSPSKVTTGRRIEDVNSGVEAINGGLGIAVTKSWGMVDNRTISAVTPVDDPPPTSASWSTSAGRPARTRPRAETKAREFGAGDHPRSSSRTSTSGSTSAIRIRPRWPPPSTRASPRFASGPSSSIPTAAAAAPPKRTQHLSREG